MYLGNALDELNDLMNFFYFSQIQRSGRKGVTNVTNEAIMPASVLMVGVPWVGVSTWIVARFLGGTVDLNQEVIIMIIII